MERCSKCIFPVNLPSVSIFDDGECNYCKKIKLKDENNLTFPFEQSQERFENILEKIRGKGKHDCMAGISGGKDSTYILYLLVKKYHMNVLAYTFDNGYLSVQALKNIENAVNILGVDWIVYKPNRDIMHRLFRTFFMNAGEFCTPCNMLMDASGLRFARQNNIKVGVSGSSDWLSDSVEGMTTSSYYDRKYYFNVLADQMTRKQVKDFVSPSYFNKGLRRLLGIEPVTVNPFDYLRPTLTEIKQTLQRELNWKNPSEQIEHGDCLLNVVKNYILYRRWGCSTVTTKCSAMIRDGQMTRKQALEWTAKHEQKDQPKIFPKFLDALNLTESQFNDALTKDFTVFPNYKNKKYILLTKKILNFINGI